MSTGRAHFIAAVSGLGANSLDQREEMAGVALECLIGLGGLAEAVLPELAERLQQAVAAIGRFVLHGDRSTNRTTCSTTSCAPPR